jgi:glycosyltransferase involved in cell wall biosynthesis
MKSPWLSVIVPTYNGSAYLAQALDSIAMQRDPDIEIIAVDDGSTDDTVAILRHYAANLPLRVIERPSVGSWVANSDFALRQASGSYASFLHQDDLWRPGRLRRLRERVERLPDITLWLHPVWFVDAAGRKLGRWTCPLPARPEGLGAEFVLERLLVQNFVAMPAPLFQREAALAVGGMDARLWYVADWDLWLKLAGQGKTAYLSRPLAAFRIHLESQTIKRGVDQNDLLDQYERAFQNSFSQWTVRDAGLRDRIRALFEASTAVNLTLMAHVQRQRAPLRPLLWKLLRLGPLGWKRFLRDSRLAERAIARWRCRLRR